jgi:glycosyltransferase involved in cell wall biosynthesis
MRVLQVTSYYAPAWAYGGPPRVMADFAEALVALGHEVTVFTTDVLDGERRASPRRESLGGVHVERFPNLSNSLAWRSKKYLPPGLIAATARKMRSFDVVHATDTRTVATATAYLASRIAGVPFVLSAHGSLPGSTGLRGTVKGIYDRALVRPMLDHAALLLAQTAHEEQLYREAGGRDSAIELLPLPFNLAAVPEELDRDFLRRLAGMPADLPLVLFLGRIHYLKGLDLLVDAMSPLLANGEAGLVVVGRDDGHWSDIAAQHRDLLNRGTLSFIGPLYGTERFDAYADADLFALTPRHWEETSVAAVEAAASTTGVLVTEQADIPGLAESGGGVVVPLHVDAIRAGLREGLAHSLEMGPRARRLVERQHARERVAEQFETLLHRVVDS